jgi:hypothetical protein
MSTNKERLERSEGVVSPDTHKTVSDSALEEGVVLMKTLEDEPGIAPSQIA